MNHTTKNLFARMSITEFTDLINSCYSLSHVFDKINKCKTGPQYKNLKNRIIELNLDTSHFKRRIINGRCLNRPVTDYLIRDSTYTWTSNLKKLLFDRGIFKRECSECSLGEVWNNKPLSLQLHHINGIRNDNRIENLQILCPNCHAQTNTFSGKKHKQEPKLYFCQFCHKPTSQSECCRLCWRTNFRFKVATSLPPDEIFSKLVWESPLYKLCKEYHLSSNGIKKHCKKRGIQIPTYGYWQRRQLGYSHEESLKTQKRIKNKARRMSKDEIQTAKQLKEQGMSKRKISQILGYAHTTINRNL